MIPMSCCLLISYKKRKREEKRKQFFGVLNEANFKKIPKRFFFLSQKLNDFDLGDSCLTLY